MGVTELGRMLGNDPNMALSVLYGLGRWEAGKTGGCLDPQRRGWVRVGEEGGESSSISSSSSNSTSTSSWERTTPAKKPQPPPPRRPPRNPRSPATSRVARKRPDPPHPTPSPRPRPSPRARARPSPPPPPQPQPSPPLANTGRDPYGNVPGVGDTQYVPWAEGGNGGPSAK